VVSTHLKILVKLDHLQVGMKINKMKKKQPSHIWVVITTKKYLSNLSTFYMNHNHPRVPLKSPANQDSPVHQHATTHPEKTLASTKSRKQHKHN